MPILQICNAVIFQATWFGCVLGGAAGQPIWGFLGVGVLLGLNLRQPPVRSDLFFMAVLGVIGLVLDTFWIELGVLSYPGGWLAPMWIVALWLGFALTVNHSLAWLQQKPLLAGLMAAAAAPLSYLGGERLGAVTVPDLSGLWIIALAWGVLFYAVFTAASRLSAVRGWGAAPLNSAAAGVYR